MDSQNDPAADAGHARDPIPEVPLAEEFWRLLDQEDTAGDLTAEAVRDLLPCRESRR